MRRIAIRFFMGSQITITTIILYYFRGKGRRRAWLGIWDGNTGLGISTLNRVWKREGGEGKLRGVQGRPFFSRFYCITVSVLLIFSSSLLSTMSIYTHHQVVSGSGDELGHNIANGRFNKKPQTMKREVVRSHRGQHQHQIN